MTFILQSFAEDVLAADITDSATSMTLTTGNFGTPTGEQMFVIDPDITAKREVVKAAVDGTAVTSIDRAQDGTAAVAHTSGAKVIMAWTKSHHDALKDGTDIASSAITSQKLEDDILAGWLDADESWAYASASTITVPSDATTKYAVGDKIKLTQPTDGVKYFYVTAVASTVLTVTGGSDYDLDDEAITSPLYSKAASPVGFPGSFNFDGNGTGFSAVDTEVGVFQIVGDRVYYDYYIKGTSNSAALNFTLPVAAKVVSNDLVRTMDEGTSDVGRISLSASSTTAVVGKTYGGDDGFTSSGSSNGKRLFGYNRSYQI